MSWNLVSPNTWSNSNSPYIIKYDNNLGQYIVENVNGENFIPLSDIFNNPAFPIDLSNVDVLVKSLTSSGIVSGTHLRSEALNTPATPGHSFKTEINSGFYRKSAGVLAFSILGNQNGEIGAGYGGFPGNLIQLVSDTQNYLTQNSGTSYVDIIKALSTVWEFSITPKLPNSKIFVLYKLLAAIGNDYYGFRIQRKVNSGGTYVTVYNPHTVSGGGAGEYGTTTVNGGYISPVIPVMDIPTYTLGDSIFYKIAVSCYSGGQTISVNVQRTGTGSNNGHSEVYLGEIAQ